MVSHLLLTVLTNFSRPVRNVTLNVLSRATVENNKHFYIHSILLFFIYFIPKMFLLKITEFNFYSHLWFHFSSNIFFVNSTENKFKLNFKNSFCT
jgi:hypothetical protein